MSWSHSVYVPSAYRSVSGNAPGTCTPMANIAGHPPTASGERAVDETAPSAGHGPDRYSRLPGRTVRCRRSRMKADDLTNRPLAVPSSPTVSRTTASPPYSGAHGATITAPGRDCSIQAYGIRWTEQVAITRSNGGPSAKPSEPSPTTSRGRYPARASRCRAAAALSSSTSTETTFPAPARWESRAAFHPAPAPISSTRSPSATPRAASMENTIVGMELDEVGTVPRSNPLCSPSSHCVVSGASE